LNRRQGVVVKSDRELETMRRAGRVNALALAACVAALKPGMTTAEIDEIASDVLRQHGAKSAFMGYPGPYPYPAVINISVNDELVHGIPGRRRLESGDIVSIDCGSVVDGFVADSALTVGVGPISDEAQRLIDTTRESLFAGIDEMRPGHRTGDVSAAIEARVESDGFEVVREYTGHGVGRHMHEMPQVPNYGKAGTGLILRRGITIALEPMVLTGRPETWVLEDQWTVASRDGGLTAHFEHSVAVTDGEPLILTALDPADLDAVDAILYNQYFADRYELGVEQKQGDSP
jgi:methionyl aminopeptidase